MPLPTVDFADFVGGPDWKRREIGQQLIDSFKAHGFVKLINHGIPESTVKELFQWVKIPISRLQGPIPEAE